MKPTLIYAYDPLCGWCFGFHTILEKIVNRFEGSLNIEVKTGGLATGDRVQTISDGYSYIKNGLKQVEQTTGVEFGRNFKLLAEEGSYLYDSLPPCRAQVTANDLAPGKAVPFAGALHNALFVEGKSLNEPETFYRIAGDLDISRDLFKSRFEDEWSTREAESQFEWCRRNGAAAFPTLLLKFGKETGIMSRGYRPYDILESHLHHLLRNLEKISS